MNGVMPSLLFLSKRVRRGDCDCHQAGGGVPLSAEKCANRLIGYLCTRLPIAKLNGNVVARVGCRNRQ